MQFAVIVRYGEIGLKGGNRDLFERQLCENIREALKGKNARVHNRYGRILVLPDTAFESSVYQQALARVFGIENFSFGYVVPSKEEALAQAVIFVAQQHKEWQTFRISTRRQDKTFPKTSAEMDRSLGGAVLEVFPEKIVRMKGADLDIHVEITDRETFVTASKHAGPGGLPVGISGRVVCLLSGGIDSPVAAWYLLKRGCTVSFIHFHSLPYTDRASLEKVKELAQVLQLWGADGEVKNIAFASIQKEIVKETAGAYRILFYRRFMVRIAEAYARSVRAKAIATGDNLGQVASQTIENMSVVEEACGVPVFRPLLGFDKSEIIAHAKLIGTYEISILPHTDCCTFFVPRHPATKARLEDVQREEQKLDVKGLVASALDEPAV